MIHIIHSCFVPLRSMKQWLTDWRGVLSSQEPPELQRKLPSSVKSGVHTSPAITSSLHNRAELVSSVEGGTGGMDSVLEAPMCCFACCERRRDLKTNQKHPAKQNAGIESEISTPFMALNWGVGESYLLYGSSHFPLCSCFALTFCRFGR